MVTFEEGPKIDTCLTRAFLDACQLAKRMLSILPPLPDWMAPRQVHVIDAIYQIGLRQDGVRPSDVAQFHEHLTELFADIPERDICVTVAVIEETWERLKDDNFKLPLSDSKEV